MAPICPGHYRQVPVQTRNALPRVTKNKKAAAIRGLGPELGESDARATSHHAYLYRSACSYGSVPG